MVNSNWMVQFVFLFFLPLMIMIRWIYMGFYWQKNKNEFTWFRFRRAKD